MLLMLVLLALIVAAATISGHRRRRHRWVSPYAGFRAAAARVTRTEEGAFRVAGVASTGAARVR